MGFALPVLKCEFASLKRKAFYENDFSKAAIWRITASNASENLGALEIEATALCHPRYSVFVSMLLIAVENFSGNSVPLCSKLRFNAFPNVLF